MDIEDIIKSPDSKLNEEQISIIRNELIKNDFDSTFEFIKNIRKTFKIIRIRFNNSCFAFNFR